MAQPILTYSINWGTNNVYQKLSGKTYIAPNGQTVDCSTITVTFSSSQHFKKFYVTAVKNGNDYGFINDVLVDIRQTNPTGVLLHELTSRDANTNFNFTINTSSFTAGDGQYRIGLYVQNDDNIWNYEYFLVDVNNNPLVDSQSNNLQTPVQNQWEYTQQQQSSLFDVYYDYNVNDGKRYLKSGDNYYEMTNSEISNITHPNNSYAKIETSIGNRSAYSGSITNFAKAGNPDYIESSFTPIEDLAVDYNNNQIMLFYDDYNADNILLIDGYYYFPVFIDFGFLSYLRDEINVDFEVLENIFVGSFINPLNYSTNFSDDFLWIGTFFMEETVDFPKDIYKYFYINNNQMIYFNLDLFYEDHFDEYSDIFSNDYTFSYEMLVEGMTGYFYYYLEELDPTKCYYSETTFQMPMALYFPECEQILSSVLGLHLSYSDDYDYFFFDFYTLNEDQWYDEMGICGYYYISNLFYSEINHLIYRKRGSSFEPQLNIADDNIVLFSNNYLYFPDSDNISRQYNHGFEQSSLNDRYLYPSLVPLTVEKYNELIANLNNNS